MAVDKATKEQDELELYQIDDKAIVPFFQKHLEELREFIRNHGFDCMGDDTIDDYEEYMADEHPDVDTSEYEECAVASPEFLCENKYNWEHDVDWVEFQISFYGIWCKEGVFFVSH